MGEESDDEGCEEPHAGWSGGRVSRREWSRLKMGLSKWRLGMAIQRGGGGV